jgi:hypothetical protein
MFSFEVSNYITEDNYLVGNPLQIIGKCLTYDRNPASGSFFFSRCFCVPIIITTINRYDTSKENSLLTDLFLWKNAKETVKTREREREK